MKWKQIAGAALVVGLLMCLWHSATAGDKSAATKQVFVVNTGDASVSLVDLTNMKEVKTWKVGPRPLRHRR